MRKINNIVSDRSDVKAVFKFGYFEQKEYINSLPAPKDLLDRSFYQYKCHQYGRSKNSLIFLNLISFASCIPLTIMYLFKGLFIKKMAKSDKPVAVFPYKGKYDRVIPNSLYADYEIKEVVFGENGCLLLVDLRFIWQLLSKYPANFYFIVKIIYKIAMYRSSIQRFSPEAIIVCSEYAFSSSFMTHFCRSNNVRHINVMHGDKLFSVIDAFFEFDNCYVWDQHYIDLFIELRAQPTQFIINIPEALLLNLKQRDTFKHFITYYLGGENESQMLKIRDLLSRFNSIDSKVCVRYHPRYSDLKLVESIFANFEIEDPANVSLKESFSNTKNIISFYSTVLYQGYLNNKNVVIDNFTNGEELYQQLRDFKCIALYKPHQLITEL